MTQTKKYRCIKDSRLNGVEYKTGDIVEKEFRISPEYWELIEEPIQESHHGITKEMLAHCALESNKAQRNLVERANKWEEIEKEFNAIPCEFHITLTEKDNRKLLKALNIFQGDVKNFFKQHFLSLLSEKQELEEKLKKAEGELQ